MATYGYAVLYEPGGRFLMPRKNTRGYFYYRDGAGSGGDIYRTGMQIRSGGGDLCLPGGGCHADESIPQCANREFFEEVGFEPVTYADRAHNWYGGPWDESKGLQFGAAFYQCTTERFNALRADVSARLAEGQKAVQDIQSNKISSYTDLHKKYPTAPWDNELATLDKDYSVLNGRDWQVIESWQKDPAKSWFFTILKTLKTYLGS
ncbi:NUDIX hydrolase [Streptomyces sp. NPDC048290]|uniref:NUDIX hydrolase n=1 Tax=Streptomyces sp. NPDC048290 TaxID=3155811 RepID=UPI00341A86E0